MITARSECMIFHLFVCDLPVATHKSAAVGAREALPNRVAIENKKKPASMTDRFLHDVDNDLGLAGIFRRQHLPAPFLLMKTQFQILILLA